MVKIVPSNNQTRDVITKYITVQLVMTLILSAIVYFINPGWVKYALVGGSVAIIGNGVFGLMTRTGDSSDEDFAAIKILAAEFIKYILVIVLLISAIAWFRPGLNTEGIVLPAVFFIVYIVPVFIALSGNN